MRDRHFEWIAGLIGLIFRCLSVPAAPFLMGFILSPLLENSFRETLMQNEGAVLAFFTSPISWLFWALSLFTLYFIVKRRRKPPIDAAAA